MPTGGSSPGSGALEPWSGASAPVVRRFRAPTPELAGPGYDQDGEPGLVAPPELGRGPLFDDLVEAVVDRIEQRVVEELERRGRRQDWTAF